MNSQGPSSITQSWQNAIRALERPEKKISSINNEALVASFAAKKNRIFPLALVNKLFIANLALNHNTNAVNPNLGLWETLRMDKLRLASQLAGQGIYA